MKPKIKKTRKPFLTTLKAVGPRQVPMTGPWIMGRPPESEPKLGLSFALVFPEATLGQMVSPLYFSQTELEAVANFIALQDEMPAAFRPLLPLAQTILKGWLGQVAKRS